VGFTPPTQAKHWWWNSTQSGCSLSDVRLVVLLLERSASFPQVNRVPPASWPWIDRSRLGPLHKEANRRDDDGEYDCDLNYARQSHSLPRMPSICSNRNCGCRGIAGLPHRIPTSLPLDTYSIGHIANGIRPVSAKSAFWVCLAG